MSVASWCCKSFCVVPCVSFCTGHFVMVPLNMTYLHCLQHSLFEHLQFILYLRFCLPFKTCALVLFWVRKSQYNVICKEEYLIVTCEEDWSPLLHAYSWNEILPVSLPTVSMECNGRKYSDCRRWFLAKHVPFTHTCVDNLLLTNF